MCQPWFGRVKAAAGRLLLLRSGFGSGFRRHGSGMAARVWLEPGYKCLSDEPVRVRVGGLSPLQPVTMRAGLSDEKGETFGSAAFYRADERGELDLNRSPSLGGHYTGTEPMGLFWSLTPVKPFSRLVKRDVAGSPLRVHIEVFDGHDGDPQERPLASCVNERWFMKEGVTRIPVREGRVRGVLFVPPGSGPFPGVICLHTINGGVGENKASLLANHGFITLALAYLNYEDLPKSATNLDLEYFSEAVNFLKQHPKVKRPGIGAVGISKGGDVVLSMATFLPDVRAAVIINGCNASAIIGMHFKNKVISAGVGYSLSRMRVEDSGVANIVDIMNEVNKESLIPVEKAEGTILFVVGDEDKNWKSTNYANEAIKRMKKHGNEKFDLLTYQGAGHYLEPPYFPFCYASYHSVARMYTMWGGNAKDHAFAQEDMWPKVQSFLKKTLNN
ncbi:acyl-coenzyme A thioesterase 1-like isoform X1 [Leucoraja erinacea]|uniref:acyl-coenzyme A thioesterase 1-like isoform X1 n=1 Tax=Leucoraja erinaceus TaxID=7782 RepID=UPI002453826E|nr:acyl-coenzyme A thioesterase 1-like isoform X1 [Leucoraja erinacea]